MPKEKAEKVVGLIENMIAVRIHIHQVISDGL